MSTAGGCKVGGSLGQRLSPDPDGEEIIHGCRCRFHASCKAEVHLWHEVVAATMLGLVCAIDGVGRGSEP